jgi:hypothetical protein
MEENGGKWRKMENGSCAFLCNQNQLESHHLMNFLFAQSAVCLKLRVQVDTSWKLTVD